MAFHRGHLLALATALVSGISVFYNASALKGTDPFLFTALKNSLAALLLLGAILLAGSWPEIARLERKRWLQLLAIGVLGGSIPFALFFWGLSQVSDAATGSFLYRILFFAASAMAVVFLKERLRPNVVLGVLALLAANALLLRQWGPFGPGEGLVLLATLLWAAESILSKKALEGLSPSLVAGGRMVFGSIILLAFVLASGKASPAALLSSLALPAVILSSLFLFLYVSLWYRALALTPVSEATALLASGGLVSALLSAAWAGKMPTLPESASLLLVVAGVALVLIDTPVERLGGWWNRLHDKRPWPWTASN